MSIASLLFWLPIRCPACVLHLLEAPCRVEPWTLPCISYSLVHLVNLLQCHLASFVYHQPYESNGKETTRPPDEEDLEPECVGTSAEDIWWCVCYSEVQEPVCCC